MNIHAISRPLSALLVIVLSTAVTIPAMAAPPVETFLYKIPGCQCCDAYANYLQQRGFDVSVSESPDLERVKREQGVPPRLAGCHTMLVGGYVVEGHVPVDVVQRLLRERPEIHGISLPGMPQGSPGMTGQKQGPFVIYTITDDEAKVYAVD
ncbi:MAG: DUF411 domain-containing protein [Gammaproteobacteria bacterium]